MTPAALPGPDSPARPLSRRALWALGIGVWTALTLPAERTSEVRILDVFRGAASVRVTAATWVDYMHLAKYNGRWVIVNVLWENEPAARP